MHDGKESRQDLSFMHAVNENCMAAQEDARDLKMSHQMCHPTTSYNLASTHSAVERLMLASHQRRRRHHSPSFYTVAH